MPPKAADFKTRAAIKPGAVSEGMAWSLEDAGGGGFTTVKSTKVKKDKPKETTPKPVASAPKPIIQPTPVFTPKIEEKVVQKKKKKDNVQQYLKRNAAEEEKGAEEEDAWCDVKKPKPTAAQQQRKEEEREAQKAEKARSAAERKAREEQEKIMRERKQREKEAKKREMELRKKQAEKETEKKHKDPAAGFRDPAKGIQLKTNSGAAWGGVGAPQVSNKATLPKQKKEREVKLSDEEIAQKLKEKAEEMKRKQEEAEAKKGKVQIEFTVLVQGRCYSLKELFAKNDFEHAAGMVRAYVDKKDERCRGGFFICMDGKHWSNEYTVDEWWQADAYLDAIIKLLRGDKERVTLTLVIDKEKETRDLTATMELNKASLEPERKPMFDLQHTQKHRAALHELQVGVTEFCETILNEAKLLINFKERILAACDEVAQMKKYGNQTKQSRLEEIRTKVPKKIEQLVEELPAVLEEFQKRHPDPTQPAHRNPEPSPSEQ